MLLFGTLVAYLVRCACEVHDCLELLPYRRAVGQVGRVVETQSRNGLAVHEFDHVLDRLWCLIDVDERFALRLPGSVSLC